jgi:hypothetical protein
VLVGRLDRLVTQLSVMGSKLRETLAKRMIQEAVFKTSHDVNER